MIKAERKKKGNFWAKVLFSAALCLAGPAAFAAENPNQERRMNSKNIIPDGAAFDAVNIFGKGQPNTAYARYFTGNSFLQPLQISGGTCPVSISNVTFEPGCRNNWHVHRASSGGGQVIICTAGSGWYQLEGQPAVSMEPGDAAYFPAGVKHWHGAKAGSWFSHLAFELPGENTSNEWLEPVTDAEYRALAE